MMKKFACFLLLFFISCSSFKLERTFKIDKSDWTQFGDSPERFNISQFQVNPPLKLVWTYNARAGFSDGAMLVADGLLFIATLAGEVHVVDIEKGKRLGSISSESAISSCPAIYRDILIIASSHGKNTLELFNITTGRKIHSKKLGAIESHLLLLGDNLFVATIEGVVYNFTLKYSVVEEVWRFKADKPIRSAPASDGKNIYFGCDDGSVYCVDIASGLLKWRFKTNASIFAPVSVFSGKIFVGSLDGNFYAINGNGKLEWRFNSGSKIYGGCAVNDSLVFFGTSSGKVYAVNINTGEKVWEFSAGSVVNSAPVISDEVLYIGSLDKNIYAIDAKSGKLLWKYETNGRIKTSPLVWKDHLFVASEDRQIYAFKTQMQATK